MDIFKEFKLADIQEFESEAKVGLIATINSEGLPHLTFIAALQAKNPTQLIFGQFFEGLSKKNVKVNPRTGFLIMSLQRELWRGKAIWTHEVKDGEDYVMYNKKPMFRYNSYFGVHTVHYMDLVETYGRERLHLGEIVRGALTTKLVKGMARTCNESRILKPWAEGLFNRLDSLKYIAYVTSDGFPVIVPIIQCQASDSRRLVFTMSTYEEELAEIKVGSVVAVYGLTLQMENVLVRGVFSGFKRCMGIKLGTVDIEWVYNSMPPIQGQIYPVNELKPVTDF